MSLRSQLNATYGRVLQAHPAPTIIATAGSMLALVSDIAVTAGTGSATRGLAFGMSVVVTTTVITGMAAGVRELARR